MAGTASLAFGNGFGGYNHAPRHIPVRDIDAPKRKPAPLSGYMIDPRYLAHSDNYAPIENVRTEPQKVPPLTSLGAAQRSGHGSSAGSTELALATVGMAILLSIEKVWAMMSNVAQITGKRLSEFIESARASDAGPVEPRDWRRVALPIAAMMFIIGLGVANGMFKASAPSPNNGTTSQSSGNNGTATTGPSPSPSANTPAGQSGVSQQSPTQNSQSATTSTTQRPVGGRGGGDDSGVVPPGATVQTQSLQPMTGK